MSEPRMGWLEVLDRIEQSLQQSLALSPEPAPLAPKKSPAPPLLEQLDQRMGKWQECLENAENNARQVEELLVVEQAAFQACREQIALVRDTLTTWRNLLDPPQAVTPTPTNEVSSASNPPAT